jgi:2-oxoglutarate dehydrogenase E2 component (dihydrolipoamide succinyltransferase)
VQPGATVQVNTVVGVIANDGETASVKASAPTTQAPPPAPAQSAPAPPQAAPVSAPAQAQASGPAQDVIMPQMGESIFEGTITKWLKQPREHVPRDEPLFEISTDKVDAEIPSPASGVLREIKVQAGQTVQVNTVVATIGGAGAATAAPAQPSVPATPAAAAATTTGGAASTEGPAPQQPAAEEEELVVDGKRVRSSPLVRKIAKEHNVSLASVPGTGLGGRITKEDILKFIEQHPAGAPAPARPAAPAYQAPTAPAQPAAAAALPATPANQFAGVPGTVEQMSVMRKKIAEHMVVSRRTSAHVHGVFEIDFTKIVKLREKMKNSFQEKTGLKLTYTPFYARAVAHALRVWPIVNSSVEGDTIHYKKDINIGIAVALDWGLIVPVVKRADELSFVGLQRAITDLGERARSKKLKPDDVQGGTFTITNPGIFGAMFGMPIINQPQVAIMGVGAIYKTPAVVTDKDGNDSIAIRSICHLSIGYDHRIIDGAVADQFMVVVKNYLENWNQPLI